MARKNSADGKFLKVRIHLVSIVLVWFVLVRIGKNWDG